MRKRIGNDITFTEYCAGKRHAKLDYVEATAAGDVTFQANSSAHKTYVNANKLITYNAFGSGGLAHSDIYRKEMGMLLWNGISAKTQ